MSTTKKPFSKFGNGFRTGFIELFLLFLLCFHGFLCASFAIFLHSVFFTFPLALLFAFSLALFTALFVTVLAFTLLTALGIFAAVLRFVKTGPFR